MGNEKITYKSSGVDVNSGYQAVRLMKKHVNKTFTSGVLSGIGGFGGLFAIDKNKYKEPILVSGTDGVGTKLLIAFMMDKHDTIGEDCVAMSVNDVLCQGAEPLFFLDYIATAKLHPEKVEKIVEGVANGCIKAGCALIGGETAEMPGLYSEGEYDVAGFTVGIVDKENIINGSNIKAGNVLIGLPSSGLHSNGFSLVRKLLFDINKMNVNEYVSEFGSTLGEELLKPTRIYTHPLTELMRQFRINGISHITGGGFYENIPRILPEGTSALIDRSNVEIPPVFSYLKRLGNIDIDEMYSTFNMGVGIVMAVEDSDADSIIKFLVDAQCEGYIIGEVVNGEGGIKICHK